MGITTIYKCDKCQHEQEEVDKPRQLWQIQVGIKCKDTDLRTSSLSSRQTALWCRNCVENVHMLEIPKHEKQRERPPIPTLEDLVTRIVETCLEEHQHG